MGGENLQYIIIILIISIIGFVVGNMIEKKGFNGGICPHCNKRLRNFDTDSQGGRGYNCDCGYHTWVSYKYIDKNFYNELLNNIKSKS